MKYAAEMGSGAMIYKQRFIEVGSGVQRLIFGDTQTHRQQGDLISLLQFLQNKKSRLKIEHHARKTKLINKYVRFKFLLYISG
jgi:hypothetical protein